jgi:hypothetical protein
MGSTKVGYATCATLGAVDCGSALTARRVLKPWRWAAGSANQSGLVRLGWSALGALRARLLPRLESAALTVEEVDPFTIDAELRAFSRQLSETHVCTLRSGSRWQWLLRSPLFRGEALAVRRRGELIGFVALVRAYRSRRLVGTVADICLPRIDEAPHLLAAGAARLAQSDVDGITFTITSEIGRPFLAQYGFAPQSDARMGTWLHQGMEHVLQKPWFMTLAENLAVAAGIDAPVVLPGE